MEEDIEEIRQRYQKVLEALDKAVEEGHWDKGLLFQTIGKKLKQYRDRFRVLLESDDVVQPEGPVLHLANRVAERKGMVEVSIALYCSEGGDPRRWESVIHTLGATIVSRAIYKNEADVVRVIRSKPTRINEGYCKIYIQESSIAKPFTGQNPRDKMGHELLVLKQGAVSSSNIVCFIHQTGVYDWIDGRLVKRQDNIESTIS